MTVKSTLLTLALCTLVPAALSAGETNTMTKERRDIIDNVVAKAAHVQKGDYVLITGNRANFPVMEAVAIAVMKRGAYPYIAGSWSGDMLDHVASDVPPSYDASSAKFDEKLTGFVNVVISVGQDDVAFVEALARFPEARRQAAVTAWSTVQQNARKNGQRSVWLGNQLFPTERKAKEHGITLGQLETAFWSGLAADYAQLEADGQALVAALHSAKKMTITDPNGTNLTLMLKGGKPFASDGVISDADIKAGGARLQTWLPAGEVLVMPTPGSAKGTVIFKRRQFMNGEVRNLRLKVKNGGIVSMKADKTDGYKSLRKRYDAAPKGKEQISGINFGINRTIQSPQGKHLSTWIPAGTVSIAFGRNDYWGGDRAIPFSYDGFLNRATVKLDDVTIVKDGKLQIPGAGSR